MASKEALEQAQLLARQDAIDTRQAATIYGSALQSIKEYVRYFYDNYAIDGVLDKPAMYTMPNARDREMWRKVLKQFEGQLSKTEPGRRKLLELKRVAGFDRISLLNSVTGIAIGFSTATADDYFGRMLVREYKQANDFQVKMSSRIKKDWDYHKPTADDVNTRAAELVNAKNYDLTVSERIWVHNDFLEGEVKQALSKALTVGIDDKYMQEHLFRFIKQNKDSVATDFDSTERWISNRLIKNEKGRLVKQASVQVFKLCGIKWVNWVTRPGACDICLNIARDNPYPINKIPATPHNGDRCFLEPANPPEE